MGKGIVYILTNPCLDGWVKIGMTNRDDIRQRLNELNRPTNIPLMFRAYALYHVDDPVFIEKTIHEMIDQIDGSLHAREELASGRIREREFFRISPERAYGIFKSVAKLRGELDDLELVAATEEEQVEEEIESTRLPNFRFSMVDLPVGTELHFLKDDSITCTVADDKNKVEYLGETWSLSGLAAHLLGYQAAQGPKYFIYEDDTLYDLRIKMEAARETEAD